MEELSLIDILNILKRRRKYFFVTAFLIFIISMIFALNWSNYRSMATVQIEQSYVSSNVTSQNGMNANDTMIALADQRISNIEQKVTGLESLSEIITKFNLFPGQRDSTPISQLADRMRSKIKLNLVSSVISNPAAAMKETAEQLSAIAFSLSFDYSDPQITQKVEDELVTRFLDEDLKQRRTQAQETSAFIGLQISQLEASMAEQEKAIAQFRDAHGESGPAALMFNQQANVTTTMSIQNIDSQLAANEGNVGNLRSQLAITEPYSRVIADGQVLTTPAIQLKALETQFAALSAQYGPEHPDVVKARHQIQALKAQIGPIHNQPEQLNAQITDIRTNLAAAQTTLGPDHPDVLSLKRQLASLEARQAAQAQKASSDDMVKHDADNPAYLQVVAQLKAAEEQHKALLAQRDILAAQQIKYEKNIAENPNTEQQMSILSRDYDNARLRYRELKEKKMSADMMEQLEQGRKGQRLVVINPPAVPLTTQPARILLIMGGTALSIISGLCSIILAELMSQSVHGDNHIAALLGAMPLVVIPYIYTEKEANNPLRRWGTISGIRRSFNDFIAALSYLFDRMAQKILRRLATARAPRKKK